MEDGAPVKNLVISAPLTVMIIVLVITRASSSLSYYTVAASSCGFFWAYLYIKLKNVIIRWLCRNQQFFP